MRARDLERRVMVLRMAGATYAQIGETVGLTASGAQAALQRALAKATPLGAETAAELRALEVERFDALLLGLWDKARGGDVAAIDRVLKISHARAELLGLNAPMRAEVAGLLTWVDVVRAAGAPAAAELGEEGADDGDG